MSWGGIDLIPRREGESSQDAVDRVYEGGLQIVFAGGAPEVEEIRTTASGDDSNAMDAGWMIETIELLEAQLPGWSTDRLVGEAARDGSGDLVVEHPGTPFWALVTPECVTLQRVRTGPPAQGDWALWWQTAQRFAAAGYVVFHPDTSEILDPSLDAREADMRYALM